MAFKDRSNLATARIAQLAAAAQGNDGNAWDRYYSEAYKTLSSTQYVSPDIALMAEQAGRAAMDRGWEERARDALGLALAQWTRLGRIEEADRVQWSLD